MDYKSIIKNKELRLNILDLLSFIPDSCMLKLQYKLKLGRELNLINPQRFTEKIQWYKLNYRNPIMTICSDKYNVRDYIESKGLRNILNKLYAVYDDVDDIDLDSLPEKFVLKTTNGSGTNIFCKDKSNFLIDEAKITLNKWLRRDFFSYGREWSYKNIRPKIIAEELIEDQYNQFDGINDYKFLCFNGEAKYIILDVDRFVDHKRNIYDVEWNFINVSTDKPNLNNSVLKPDGLDEMLNIANTLAEDFPFVRVDLYWVNNRVYFGELTFYPWSGYVQFEPDEFDFILGEQFKLPV